MSKRTTELRKILSDVITLPPKEQKLGMAIKAKHFAEVLGRPVKESDMEAGGKKWPANKAKAKMEFLVLIQQYQVSRGMVATAKKRSKEGKVAPERVVAEASSEDEGATTVDQNEVYAPSKGAKNQINATERKIKLMRDEKVPAQTYSDFLRYEIEEYKKYAENPVNDSPSFPKSWSTGDYAQLLAMMEGFEYEKSPPLTQDPKIIFMRRIFQSSTFWRDLLSIQHKLAVAIFEDLIEEAQTEEVDEPRELTFKVLSEQIKPGWPRWFVDQLVELVNDKVRSYSQALLEAGAMEQEGRKKKEIDAYIHTVIQELSTWGAINAEQAASMQETLEAEYKEAKMPKLKGVKPEDEEEELGADDDGEEEDEDYKPDDASDSEDEEEEEPGAAAAGGTFSRRRPSKTRAPKTHSGAGSFASNPTNIHSPHAPLPGFFRVSLPIMARQPALVTPQAVAFRVGGARARPFGQPFRQPFGPHFGLIQRMQRRLPRVGGGCGCDAPPPQDDELPL